MLKNIGKLTSIPNNFEEIDDTRQMGYSFVTGDYRQIRSFPERLQVGYLCVLIGSEVYSIVTYLLSKISDDGNVTATQAQ